MRIQDRAKGKWEDILVWLEVADRDTLSGKNCACPICGGRDRFRFFNTNKLGTWICNKCGSGDGFNLIMGFLDCTFTIALSRVESALPHSKTKKPKEIDYVANQEFIDHVAPKCKSIFPGDPVFKYLTSRGLRVHQSVQPKCLYWVPNLEGKFYVEYQAVYFAMVALILDSTGGVNSLQALYLNSNGEKSKIVKPVRKTCPPASPMKSYAVRLYPVMGNVMGIAEGVETALACNEYFKIPTWAVLGTSSMEKFEPPPHIKKLHIFADNDESFAGAKAAYTLASRLKRTTNLKVHVIIPKITGFDWLDILNKERKENENTENVETR